METWRTVAGEWESGEAQLEDVVFAATAERKFDELVDFIQGTTASTSALADTSVPSIKRFVLQCAYKRLHAGDVTRAEDILRGVDSSLDVDEWFRNAWLHTLDPSARRTAADALRSHGSLSAQEEELLKQIDALQEIYTCSHYAHSLSSWQFACAAKRSDCGVVESIGSALLSCRGGGTLADGGKACQTLCQEVGGMMAPGGVCSLWELGTSGVGKDGHMPGEDSACANGQVGPAGGSAQLYMRTAASWLKDKDCAELGALYLEGTSLLNAFQQRDGGLAKMGDSVGDFGDSWMVRLYYYASRYMVKELVDVLGSIPSSHRGAGTIVIRKGTEEWSLDVDVLNLTTDPTWSSFVERLIGEQLLCKHGLWLRREYKSVEEWFGLLASSGVLLSGVEPGRLEGLKNVLRSDAATGLIVEHCCTHNLPHMLQHYLESHWTPLSTASSLTLLKGAANCHWAQWLILSRLPDQSFAAAVASARSLAKTSKSGPSQLVSLQDVLLSGSIFSCLATLTSSPLPLNRCFQQYQSRCQFPGSATDVEGYNMVDGKLINVQFACTVAALDPILREHPAAKNALQDLSSDAYSRPGPGPVDFDQYFGWRSSILSMADRTGSILGCLSHLDAGDVSKLLKLCAGDKSMMKQVCKMPKGVAQPEEWEQKVWDCVDTWLGAKDANNAKDGKGAEDSVEDDHGVAAVFAHHLCHGRPVAALQWFLHNTPRNEEDENKTAAGTSSSILSSRGETARLLRLTTMTALLNYASSKAVSASVALLLACGQPTLNLRVAVSSLLVVQGWASSKEGELSNLQNVSRDFAREFSESLSSSISMSGGAAAQALLNMLETAILEPLVSTDSVSRPLSPQQASPLKEDSPFDGHSLISPRSNTSDILVPAMKSAGWSCMTKWVLVHAFAASNRLVPSTRLLDCLAQQDDWILFLAEASAFGYSASEVRSVAATSFSDPQVGYHVGHIVMGCLEERLSSPQSGEVPMSKGPLATGTFELFKVLAVEESKSNPGQALLSTASRLQWQLLTVLAACYPGMPLLDCLTVWLDIKEEGKQTSTEEIPGCASCDKLLLQVYKHCQKRQFRRLLDGFSLFPVVPKVPIVHFLTALENSARCLYPIAQHHFCAYREALKGPLQSNETDAYLGQGYGGSADGSRTPSAQSGSSTRDTKVAHDVGVDMDLVDSICKVAAFGVLSQLQSSYEKEKLLEMLVNVLPKEGSSWRDSVRSVWLVYHLLHNEAAKYVEWSASKASGLTEPRVTDIEGVLAEMEKRNRWLQAREWAEWNGLDVHLVTRRQVECLIRERDELELGGDVSELLWVEVNQVFTEHRFPAILASVFYIQQAAALQGSAQHKSLQCILLEALAWLQGAKMQSKDALGLLTGLKRTLFLLDCNAEVLEKVSAVKGYTDTGGKYDRSPWVQMVLKPAPRSAFRTEMSADSTAGTEARGAAAHQATHLLMQEVAIGERDAVQLGLKLLGQLVDHPTTSQIDSTVRRLLEAGEIEAAKKLAGELQKRPVEMYLVDTALAIVHECGASDWSGTSVEGIALNSILTLLRKRDLIPKDRAPLPQPMLDALVQACKAGSGRAVCLRAAMTYRAANMLGISIQEAAENGPYQVLESLLTKGSEGLEIAKELSDAYALTPRATARMLAQMYLKSLLEGGDASSQPEVLAFGSPTKLAGTGPSSLLRQTSRDEFMSNAIICGDWPEVGNALLQLLLERHAALPSQVEADILVLSHNFYRRCQYVEGIDVLLELAGSRIEVYASEKNYSALVKIILGLGLYEGFRKPLDLLVQHNQLELLLKECQLTGDDARALRAAVLRSIDLHRPNDVLALDLVHKHFDVHVDIAHGLKKQALAKLEGYVKQRSNTRLLLGAMELLLMAAMEYSAADCCVAAARCSAMVALVAQQICLPERQWVLLSDSQCRKVLPKLPNIGEALVVARGYKFSSPQDWVLTLWEHMLEVASQFRVPLGVLSGRMDAMQSFAQGVQREAVFSEDQLEQIAQMYVDQRGQRSGYVLGRVNKAVLASCMLEFLRSIPDCQQRLALSQRIGGDEMAALVKECLTILDAELPSLPQADGNGVL